MDLKDYKLVFFLNVKCSDFNFGDSIFYSYISWPSLLIADMASTDVSLGVLLCVVTAGDTVQR